MTENERVTGKRILLVDDQQEVRETIKMLLDFDGHIVTEAGDGKHALELFEPGRFDLVITDYFMPRMRGDELTIKLKELAPAQLVLMVTGSAEKLGGPQAPVDGILRKPFFLEGLRQAVAHLFCGALA